MGVSPRAWVRAHPPVTRWLARVPPVLAGLALVVTLGLLLQVGFLLVTWTGRYGARGELTVDSCETIGSSLAQQIRCRGVLEAEQIPEPVTAVALGGAAAFESPDPGVVIDVFYRAGDPGRVYPVRGRSVELARAIIGAIPLLIVIVGLTAWLAGWALTRHLSPADAVGRPAVSQRFVVRSYGARWLVVGAVWLTVDRLVVSRVLGPVGLG